MQALLVRIILVITMIVFLQACFKGSIDRTDNPCYSLEACSAGDDNCKSHINFISEKKEQYKISADNSSLCPTYFLKISLKADNNVLLDTVFTESTKFEKIVELNAGTHIDAEAILVRGLSTIECVWMGKATVSVCKR